MPGKSASLAGNQGAARGDHGGAWPDDGAIGAVLPDHEKSANKGAELNLAAACGEVKRPKLGGALDAGTATASEGARRIW
jgi:hypothetical protein